jgi:hypothetical protein
LEIPQATAYSLAAYRDLCRRCLYEEDFAEEVAAAQEQLVSRVGDPVAFWEQLLRYHDLWLSTNFR